MEQKLLDIILSQLQSKGLLKTHRRQRTDSTHVLAAIRSLNRLETEEFYWYYKLHATTPIFPTRSDGKLSLYKHLGKAGSQAYIDAIEQITAKTKFEALDRSIEALKQGLKDLVEETSKYNKE
ncbi:MAG: hypothetical protein RM338_32790 [Nostoc sp. DedQUE12a]|nr:hypothetical protein [Nostoc sp. DedQUE12a]